MSGPFVTRRRIEFRDTDGAGIAHFSTYFVFMEQAEHEFLRHLGLSVVTPVDGGTLSWPRVSATCDFRKPARFDDLLDVEVRVVRLGEKSISYSFRFLRAHELLAEGKIVAVCCRFIAEHSPDPTPVPPWFADRIRPFICSND